MAEKQIFTVLLENTKIWKRPELRFCLMSKRFSAQSAFLINEAKREETRVGRIEKLLKMLQAKKV